MRKHLLGYLFTNNIVRALLLLQTLLDILIVFLLADVLDVRNYLGGSAKFEIGALLTWAVAFSWGLASIISFFIFGMSIMNKAIYFRQFLFGVLFFAILVFALSTLTGIGFDGRLLELFSSCALAILIFRTVVFVGYKIVKYFVWNRRVIIIGCNEKAKLVEHSLLNSTSVHSVVLGYFDPVEPDDKYFAFSYVGGLEEVQKFALKNNVHEIYYVLPNDPAYISDLSEFADRNFIFLGIVPDIEGQERKRVHAKYLEDVDIPVITFQYSPLQQQFNAALKRLFDIVFSAAVIVILGLPFVLVIGMAIRIGSPGPIFFKQMRPGKNNRLFACYKFRTMRVNDQGELQAAKDDSRITKVGAILRRTSLDELPQFLNVLLGDMSIVGPRPNLVRHLSAYAELIPGYALRHIVTPGITGFAQVSGYRGETRDAGLMEKRIEHDIFYMRNWSFALDIRIIWQTVGQVFRPDKKAY